MASPRKTPAGRPNGNSRRVRPLVLFFFGAASPPPTSASSIRSGLRGSHFCLPVFPTFSLSCWEANSYYPRGLILRKGNSPNFRNGWDRGVWVPGAFKLDHLHPVKPLLFPNFSNFFTFMLGGQFLLPHRVNQSFVFVFQNYHIGRAVLVQDERWVSDDLQKGSLPGALTDTQRFTPVSSTHAALWPDLDLLIEGPKFALYNSFIILGEPNL